MDSKCHYYADYEGCKNKKEEEENSGGGEMSWLWGVFRIEG